MPPDHLGPSMKRLAAERAMSFVKPGMKLGLGTGSTAREFVACIGEAVAEGLDVLCVPTSEATRQQASALGIPLATLDDIGTLDLTVDGADEIDPQLALIKGGGAAHLREKMIATNSNQFVVIADESKLVPALGSFGIPLEVVHFCWPSTARTVENVLRSLDIPVRVSLRKSHGVAVKTDNGNLILDAFPGTGLKAVATVAAALDGIVGLVEHGLLVDMATVAVIAGSNGIYATEAQRIKPR